MGNILFAYALTMLVKTTLSCLGFGLGVQSGENTLMVILLRGFFFFLNAFVSNRQVSMAFILRFFYAGILTELNSSRQLLLLNSSINLAENS